MANVTNKHDALLNVAGVDIRPGATVAVDDNQLKFWQQGHAAKIWVDKGLIEVESDKKAAADDKKAEREALFARARELNLTPAANTSSEKLAELIAEAEAKAKASQ